MHKIVITKKLLLLFIVLAICVFPLASCDDSDDSGESFGIFLIDTDELVLSDEHIKAYHSETHEIELNQKGIEKWNSYMTYETIPQLAQTLYTKKFVTRVGNKEAYRGTFWSMASSAIPEGIIISETLFKLDATHNTIQLKLSLIEPQGSDSEDPRNDAKVLNFFEERGILK